MKKDLLNLFVFVCVFALMTASAVFADVNQVGISQKQQQAELYTQQVNYLRQQTEYLQQQTEALRQQTEALKQSQAYNQGYVEGQRYSNRGTYAYTPAVWAGGLWTGYMLGHWPVHRHCYAHVCHHRW